MSYENENRDCVRCGNPLAGDNPGNICFECKRIQSDLAALRAENARLREALQRIIDAHERGATVGPSSIAQARAALAHDEKEQ